MKTSHLTHLTLATALLFLLTLGSLATPGSQSSPATQTASYIVQAASTQEARDLVVDLGGLVDRDLAIIDAVVAERLWDDLSVSVASATAPTQGSGRLVIDGNKIK